MNYKNEFQKYLIRYYENNYGVTYLVFEMNGGNEKFLDSFKGKNRKLLYRKCYDLISKTSHYNKDYNGYTYASQVISCEKCF